MVFPIWMGWSENRVPINPIPLIANTPYINGPKYAGSSPTCTMVSGMSSILAGKDYPPLIHLNPLRYYMIHYIIWLLVVLHDTKVVLVHPKRPPLDPPLNLVRYGRYGSLVRLVRSVRLRLPAWYAGTYLTKRTKRTNRTVPHVPTAPYQENQTYQPYVPDMFGSYLRPLPPILNLAKLKIWNLFRIKRSIFMVNNGWELSTSGSRIIPHWPVPQFNGCLWAPTGASHARWVSAQLFHGALHRKDHNLPQPSNVQVGVELLVIDLVSPILAPKQGIVDYWVYLIDRG